MTGDGDQRASETMQQDEVTVSAKCRKCDTRQRFLFLKWFFAFEIFVYQVSDWIFLSFSLFNERI